MPPRPSLTSSFSITDSNNEVVCPLHNQDRSHCRKRCIGVSFPPLSRGSARRSAAEARPKAAVVESPPPPPSGAAEVVPVGRLIVAVVLTLFCQLTGETLPLHAGAHSSSASRALHFQASRHRGEFPAHDQHAASRATQYRPAILCCCPESVTARRKLFAGARLTYLPGLHDRRNYYRDSSSNPGTPRHADEYITSSGGSLLGTASAAAALAELHGIKSERESDMDRVRDPDAQHPTTTPRPIDSHDSQRLDSKTTTANMWPRS